MISDRDHSDRVLGDVVSGEVTPVPVLESQRQARQRATTALGLLLGVLADSAAAHSGAPAAVLVSDLQVIYAKVVDLSTDFPALQRDDAVRRAVASANAFLQGVLAAVG